MPVYSYTLGEREALRKLFRNRQKSLRRVFKGTELTLSLARAQAWTKALTEAAKIPKQAAASLKQDISSAVQDQAMRAAAKPVDEVKKAILKEIFSVDAVSDGAAMVMQMVGESGLTTAAEILADTTPYVGVALNGLQVLNSAKDIASGAYTKLTLAMGKKHFRKGDPRAALEALDHCVDIELAFATANTVQHSVIAGAKSAGALLDLGTLTSVGIGAGSGMATLVQTLILAGIEFRWFYRGRKALQEANESYAAAKAEKAGGAAVSPSASFTAELFEKCPLLACYYLTTATHSDLVAFMLEDIIDSGEGPHAHMALESRWYFAEKFRMEQLLRLIPDECMREKWVKGDAFASRIEKSIRKMQPVRKKAAKVIADARFTLVKPKTDQSIKAFAGELADHPVEAVHRAFFDVLLETDKVVPAVRPGSKLTGAVFSAGRTELNPDFLKPEMSTGWEGTHTPESMTIPRPGIHVPTAGMVDTGLTPVTAGVLEKKFKKAITKQIGHTLHGLAVKADELFAAYVLHRLKKMARDFGPSMGGGV